MGHDVKLDESEKEKKRERGSVKTARETSDDIRA